MKIKLSNVKSRLASVLIGTSLLMGCAKSSLYSAPDLGDLEKNYRHVVLNPTEKNEASKGTSKPSGPVSSFLEAYVPDKTPDSSNLLHVSESQPSLIESIINNNGLVSIQNFSPSALEFKALPFSGPTKAGFGFYNLEGGCIPTYATSLTYEQTIPILNVPASASLISYGLTYPRKQTREDSVKHDLSFGAKIIETNIIPSNLTASVNISDIRSEDPSKTYSLVYNASPFKPFRFLPNFTASLQLTQNNYTKDIEHSYWIGINKEIHF